MRRPEKREPEGPHGLRFSAAVPVARGLSTGAPTPQGSAEHPMKLTKSEVSAAAAGARVP